MKANEAPEKIYLQENTTTDCYGEFWPEWFEARTKDSDIEYTRTDAFIEKVARFLEYKLNDRVEIRVWGTLIPSLTSKKALIKEVKEYIKGE